VTKVYGHAIAELVEAHGDFNADIILWSTHAVKQGSSVNISSRLQAGQRRNRGLIPGRDKGFLSSS
jgi:hypothetical protein